MNDDEYFILKADYSIFSSATLPTLSVSPQSNIIFLFVLSVNGFQNRYFVIQLIEDRDSNVHSINLTARRMKPYLSDFE